MAQGEFTLEEIKFVRTSLDEMFKGLSQKKQGEYIGHLNDIFMFITAAEKHIEADNTLSLNVQEKSGPVHPGDPKKDK